jgi:hypothetical protein
MSTRRLSVSLLVLLILLLTALPAAAQDDPAYLRLSPSVDRAEPGDSYTYRMSYIAEGAGLATISVVLPAAVTPLWTYSQHAGCTMAQTVVCTATLADEQPISVVIAVKVNDNACGTSGAPTNATATAVAGETVSDTAGILVESPACKQAPDRRVDREPRRAPSTPRTKPAPGGQLPRR